MHWSDAMSGAGRTGRLPKSDTDPLSGQPAFKDTPARILPFTPEWRAFLVSRDPVEPGAAYWVRSRIEGGWLTELAGEGSVDCDALLPAGTRSEAFDAKRGMRRLVVSGEDRALVAALYLTRSGGLPSREWIAKQLVAEPASLTEWLAGRPSEPMPDRGPIVCICHDVGEHDIVAAINGGARNLDAIGACTRAGTNCGSCRPIVARLIDQTLAHMKEAAE